MTLEEIIDLSLSHRSFPTNRRPGVVKIIPNLLETLALVFGARRFLQRFEQVIQPHCLVLSYRLVLQLKLFDRGCKALDLIRCEVISFLLCNLGFQNFDLAFLLINQFPIFIWFWHRVFGNIGLCDHLISIDHVNEHLIVRMRLDVGIRILV